MLTMNDIEKKHKTILQMHRLGMKVDPADLEDTERYYDTQYAQTFCEHIPQAMKQYMKNFKHPVRISIDILPEEGLIRVGAGTVYDDHVTTTLLPMDQPKYKKVLQIITPDGDVWENLCSYFTFLRFIEAAGVAEVAELNLKTSMGPLMIRIEDDLPKTNRQHSLNGWLVLTSLPNAEKVQLVNRISRKLNLEYVAAVTKIPVDE